MKNEFNIWGFNFKTKNTLLVVIVALVLLVVLILFDLFITSISWYGVIIGTGFLVALWLATQLAKNRDLPDDYPFDLILWIFPLSIVGARLYYVLFSGRSFTFVEALKVWEGGMGIYGGIVGGLIGLIICCLIKKRKIVDTMDLAAPCLIIAQAIGRWGNFVNQEVYGREIISKSLQWFPFGVKVDGSWYLATFFYESILNLIGFFILTILIRKIKLSGVVTAAYLIFYGLVRYFLEGLRIPSYILFIPGTSFPVSQAVSLAIIIIGVAWMCYLLINHRKKTLNGENKNI